jgi:hypothetical protein
VGEFKDVGFESQQGNPPTKKKRKEGREDGRKKNVNKVLTCITQEDQTTAPQR